MSGRIGVGAWATALVIGAALALSGCAASTAEPGEQGPPPVSTPAHELAPAGAPAPAPAPQAEPQRPKTILLAFDGVDHALVEQALADGQLPQLARLQERTFRPLQTSNPVQSPASWAVFNTGTNPGKTGVPGFVSRFFLRDAAGKVQGQPLPQPMLGFPTTIPLDPPIEGVDSAPYEINCMQGTNWWTHLDEAGVRFTGIQVPGTHPPDDEGPNTRLLPGLGLKDIGGSPGSWAVYTDDPWSWSHSTDTAGKIIKFNFVQQGGTVGEAALLGPRNWLRAAQLEQRLAGMDPGSEEEAQARAELNRFKRIAREAVAPMTLSVDRDAGRLDIDVSGQRVTLHAGEWSELVPVEFPLTDTYSEHGLARFFLISCNEVEVRLAVLPVSIDPLQPKPYLPISAPVDFAAELARDAHGGYETLGWAMPTNPLKDHRDSGFEAQAFFGAVERIQANRERLLRWGLDDADAWDVYYQVFYAPDRVSHMFFRETDPGHPHYDADYAAQPVEAWGRRFPLGDAVLESYREMDRIVGEVLDRIEAGEFGDDALLLVVSDHGFTSFRRGVNLNNALYELGLLHFSRDMTLDEVLASGRTDFLAFVDWDRTSAYSMGLGKIYVNLKGREPRGIVEPADVPLLIAQVREGLLALRDGPGGARVVTSVSHRDELFHGPWVHEGSDLVQKVAGEPRPLPHWDGYADLFVGFAPGYRVSWATTLGGLGPETLVDNTKHWTGGHVSVDPSHVPGILFANQAWADQGEASLLDIGPTIVARYGIDLDTTGMEGRALELAGSGSD